MFNFQEGAYDIMWWPVILGGIFLYVVIGLVIATIYRSMIKTLIDYDLFNPTMWGWPLMFFLTPLLWWYHKARV